MNTLDKWPERLNRSSFQAFLNCTKERPVDDEITNGRRLLRITPGNIRNSHIYVREHLDFFPADCIGPARRTANGNGHSIELELDGLDEVVATDIGANAANGKPLQCLWRDSRRGVARGRVGEECLAGDRSPRK
jgi:hypothetical protein